MDALRQKLMQIHGNAEFVDRLLQTKVLLVGAGGIGCEVIKGLLLCGFPDVTILDLDTIDVSNLNRQFLFQKCHVGESKAKVAAKVAVERFSHRHPETKEPLSTVKPIHDSILEMKYGKSFYEQFTFVINALDNNKTRVHVNRICIASNIPLVESGSTGYKGNSRVILAGKTECFECNEVTKDENTYASCTIRHTPTAPIHCIVWAKHLFAQLFGEADEDIAPDGAGITNGHENGQDNGQENGHQNGQENGEKNESTREYVERINYDAGKVFQKIFHHDIIYLKDAFPHMWENRKPPQEISHDDIISGAASFTDISSQTNGKEIDLSNPVVRDQQLWSIADCLTNFSDALNKLHARLKPGVTLSWDKDDDDALSFVTAASNFRCYIFSIERKSKFDVKSLAGNIIPAIPSTNTIVGGCVIIQAIKLLRSLADERYQARADEWSLPAEAGEKEGEGVKKSCYEFYISNKSDPKTPKVLSSARPQVPKPKCLACSKNVHQINIGLKLETTSVYDFVNDVIMKALHCLAPDVIVYGSDTTLWGPDLDELIEMHKKTPKMLSEYKELNAGDTLLLIEDIAQDYSVHVKLVDTDLSAEENNDLFYKILNQDELEKISANGVDQQDGSPEVSQDGKSQETIIDDDDCLEIPIQEVPSVVVNDKKRLLLDGEPENGYGDGMPTKKIRKEEEVSEVIEL